MILRRFSKHVTEQNWFAVGLDVIVVVVGIFLGMQVTEWNNSRKDRALEKEYLERLYDDMNGSIEDYKTTVPWDINRLYNQYVVLQSLREGKVTQEKEFQSGLAMVGIHNPSRRRWGTVDEMESTGNITLIQDIELRNKIAATEASYERNDLIIKASEARISHLRSRISEHFDIVAFEITLEAKAKVEYEFNTLKMDTKFKNTFADIHLSSDLIYGFAYTSIAEIELLRNQIAGILGRDTKDAPTLSDIKIKRPWREVIHVDNSK